MSEEYWGNSSGGRGATRRAHSGIRPGESNLDYCNRVAAKIPAERLVRMLLESIAVKVSKSKTKTLQGELASLLPYGNGIRCAIVRRYLGELDYD